MNPCKNFTDPVFFVESLFRKDQAAFACLYERCRQPCLSSHAQKRTQLTPEVLEDFLQDALTEFAVKLRDRKYTYEGIPPEQFVKRIHWNKCVDYWRKHGKLEPLPDDDEFLNKWETDDSEADRKRESLIERMMHEIDRIDANCQKLVKLFYFQSKPLTECGSELGITPESAKVKRFRCIDKLRKILIR